MLIIIKILLSLISLYCIGVGWFVITDYKNTLNSNEFETASLLNRALIKLVFYFILICVAFVFSTSLYFVIFF